MSCSNTALGYEELMGSFFKLYDTFETFDEAEARCLSDNATLPKPQTEREFQALKNFYQGLNYLWTLLSLLRNSAIYRKGQSPILVWPGQPSSGGLRLYQWQLRLNSNLVHWTPVRISILDELWLCGYLINIT